MKTPTPTQTQGNALSPSRWALQTARLLLPLLLFLMFSAVAHAQTSGTTSDGIAWSSANGAVTITGYTGTGGAVTVPGTISVSGSSLPVTSIGSFAFYNCLSLTSVTIPANVTSIGTDAFYYCTNLTSVTIPASVTSIGNYAFGNCGLTSLTIPSGVTNIGQGAFVGCIVLSNVNIGNGVTTIGINAFYGCTSLTSVTIPASVTSIGNQAFYNCTYLMNAFFMGNAPFMGSTVFGSTASSFTVCFFNDSTGFTTPAWNGYPAALFNYTTSNDQVTITAYSGTGGAVNIPATIIVSGSSLPVSSIGSNAFIFCFSLNAAFFMGNAPSMGSQVFNCIASGFTVNYYNGATGFTSPTWNGYTTVNMGPSPIASWLLAKGLPSYADLKSAPNHDGVPLLLAYALNLDPTRNQGGRLPKPVFDGNNLNYTYYAGNADVTYTVQTSTDLQTWSTEGVTVSAPDANNFRTATIPMTGSRRFLRLVVSQVSQNIGQNPGDGNFTYPAPTPTPTPIPTPAPTPSPETPV